MDISIRNINILQENGRTFVLSLVCITLIGVYCHYVRTYSYWKKRGIKGPIPLPLVGNMISRVVSKSPHEQATNWVKQYGKVYGYYDGSKPCLVIADPELLRQICIKDHDVVINRKSFPAQSKYQYNNLFALKDDNWKKVRAIMTPTFTSGKIKRMFKIIDSCAEDLVQCFREQIPKDSDRAIINTKDLYGLYALDTIATCCYGIKIERSGSANLKTAAAGDTFVRVVKGLLTTRIWAFLLSILIPAAIARFLGLTFLGLEPVVDRIKNVVDTRRKSGKKIDDYLQLLIDANICNQMEIDDFDMKENHHAGLTRESILEDQKNLVENAIRNGSDSDTMTHHSTKIGLTDDETYANAIILMIVGYETTSSFLGNCSYALAFHQDVQQRLFEEITKIAKLNVATNLYEFDYESVTSCNYLDAVISETLRRLPATIGFEREISHDYYIEKYGVLIEKGNLLHTPFYALSNDPDYWDEPEKFNPDRFLPENRDKIVPGAYCPFGVGPRHCIGMRFSLTESKLALAKIVMHFRFEPAPGLSFPPGYKDFFLPKLREPFVTIIPRQV